MKIGISTYAWYQLPFDRMIPLLADAGFGAISLGSQKEHTAYHTATGRAQIVRLLQQHGMMLESVHAPAGIREGRLLDISDSCREVRQHAYEETLHAIHAASEGQADYVVIHPIGTKWQDGFDLPERGRWALHSLERLQRYAEAHGVTLALENLDGPESMVFDEIYLEARELGLVYCYDNGHAFVQQDPKVYWDRMASHVRTLHLHDNDGTLDMHGSLGTGRFPWRGLRTWLQEAQYQGVIGLECKFRGTEEEEFKVWLRQNLHFVTTEFMPPGGVT